MIATGSSHTAQNPQITHGLGAYAGDPVNTARDMPVIGRAQQCLTDGCRWERSPSHQSKFDHAAPTVTSKGIAVVT